MRVRERKSDRRLRTAQKEEEETMNERGNNREKEQWKNKHEAKGRSRNKR